MAASGKSRTRGGAMNYHDLHNFSSVVLYDTATRKKGKLYEVERVISRRKCKSDFEYLMKWKDWPYSACSWEPSYNLILDLLRSYDNPPKPSSAKLEEASRNFQSGILTGLRSSRMAPVYVQMDLDVWRYVTRQKGVPSLHKGYTMYQICDFARLTSLSPHWDYFLNADGEGARIDFPLKAKPVLSWTAKHHFVEQGQLKLAPRVPIEKVYIEFAKRACNVRNLCHV